MRTLRAFNASHIDEDNTSLSGMHENELFFNCTFDKLNGLTLKDCVLSHSKFTTNNIKDALGFTLTLDCFNFKDVEFSPLLFDLYLLMAIQSSGNTEKRKKLIEILGKDRVVELLGMLSRAERKQK